MVVPFSKLKDPKLGLLDKLTFGKLKDCRICDVIQDHYDYLIWAEKQGYVKFQQIVIETIQEAARFNSQEDPENGEKSILDTYDRFNGSLSDWEDDIPF